MTSPAPPMKSTVTIFKDGGDLAAHAADFIVRVAREAIEARGRAMVALAGGTTPQATYEMLARPAHRSRIDWDHTYLFFGDERWVPANDPSSNFAMVERTLLSSVSVPPGHVFPMPTHLATGADAAASYATTLADAFGPPVGLPRFDLILLGLGTDGHTASLFPGAASLHLTDRWVVATPAGSLPPFVERITLTFPVLNAAREILFLVTGENKADALRDVLESHGGLEQRPAAGVHPGDGTLTWFVDEAAAGR